MLQFVALDDPELNVARVDQRVAQGGHPVLKDRIIARYYRALALLPSAIATSDRTVLYDNTSLTGRGLEVAATIVREEGGFRLDIISGPCTWLRRELLDHLPYSGLTSGATRSTFIPEAVLQEMAIRRTAGLTFP